jgi:proteasome component ECM29
MDIELLEKVELRLAMAEDEVQFETQIGNLLCPILLKLTSSDQNVKQKVMSICAHINKRFKAVTTIRLPTHTLVDLYAENQDTLVLSFALIYLEMGFNRISKLVRSC